MRRKNKLIQHTSHGSVLDDLKIAPEVLAAFKLKAELHSVILEFASNHSSAQLQNLFKESQPRISDFMRGKTTKFSLETLLYYAAQLGMHPQIKTTDAKNHIRIFEGAAVG
jgi:predicted XRE-type DNA-binding protein